MAFLTPNQKKTTVPGSDFSSVTHLAPTVAPVITSFLALGGEAGAIKLILLGSGKPQAPSPLPFWLKIEKLGNDYNAFTREGEDDDWQNVGQLVRDLNDSKVGIGMLNHWDGTTLTLITDSFHMEGEKVKSSAVSSNGKLAATWGELKAKQR